MRLTRLAMLTLGAALTAACSEPSNDPTTPDVPPLAFVRYINAVPDTLNTTVRFTDQVQWSPMTFVNVPFRGLGQGNYQPTQAGSRKFRVFTTDATNFSTAGNTVILVDTTLTFEAGKYYTLLHMGYARAGSTPRQRIVSINDVHPNPGAQVAVRAIHAALGVGAVDIYATATATSPISGTPLFRNVATEAVSPYANVNAAAFATQIAAAGGTTALVAAAAPAGTAGTTQLNPIAGATIAGSVLSAVAFPASPANSAGARFTTPGIVYFIDKNPPPTAP
ncbi:DUF4397 domain-containing protein [Gemmatimonas sp. UBA7669]|uniref:DUF4397 domain-containing protein n=1 Tax=Gemmatimonas sp. UBA7669 TaxID=1946568 RepID=UPI0025BE87B6|nr:DUF4397 domain-containing protein [Gemmatimonas sp. UBA7669]